MESTQRDLESARQELESIRLEGEQLKSKTLNAEVMANTLERFAQIIEGSEPPELQRLLPTVIKGVEWSEDTRKGEGVLDVCLWEEARAAFGESPALARKSKGEPLMVNGSPECQDWLPGEDSNLEPSG